MAKQNTRGGAPAAAPTPAPTAPPPSDEDNLELDAAEEDTPAAKPERSLASETDSLVAAAKRRLGLPDDAEGIDILRAIVKRGPQHYAGPPRAKCRLVVVVNGARRVVEPDALIPEGVDLSKLPSDAYEGGS